MRHGLGAAALLFACLWGCGAPRPAPPEPAPAFLNIAPDAGLAFDHAHGGTGEKNFIETMGGGVALFDADADGDLDAYLVQSGPLPGAPRDASANSRLFLNQGQGRFELVAELANEGSYGMGASAADYDNDGLVDVYVTNYGPNRLYHNEGSGRFRDVTQAAGVGDSSWSVSAAWADFDGDGLLDLYVANYVDFRMDDNKWCGRKAEGIRAYCHPDQYEGVPPRLYQNRGDGSFVDRTREAGVWSSAGKGLGVVVADLDDDADPDVFAANDSTRNYLWNNLGEFRFEDAALVSGAAYNEDGVVQACMGADAGDFDADGRLDLFTTNLDLEYDTLYRNEGGLRFTDVSYRVGVAQPHLLLVGFGTGFLDYDLDGWLDLFVANGHILDNIELTNDSLSYAQPKSLFRNQHGQRFELVSDRMPDLEVPRVSRGAAFGDIDGDGDVDILVGGNNGPAELLRNDLPSGAGFLVVRLEGRRSSRSAIGARVRLALGGRELVSEVRAGSSYASSSDPRLTLGLGGEAPGALEVRWPTGERASYADLPARSWVTIVEGDPVARITRRLDP